MDAVSDLQLYYDVPQDSSNRLGTHWVKLTAPRLQGTSVRATRVDETDGCFSFAASWAADETTQIAQHPTDLFEDDATLLRLNAAVAGVGTAACGPGISEKDLVKCRCYEFGFQLDIV